MLDNLSLKQKKILIIITIIVGIGVMYFIYNKLGTNSQEIEENIMVQNNSNSAKEETEQEKEQIIVHITGAVKEPGIVRLDEGSRMEDAIEKAGGLTEDADISDVNLAYVLEDGIKIKIPSNLDIEGEEQEIITDDIGKNITQETETANGNSENQININKATETELESLPGIGAELASRIVEYRNQNGKFSNCEDIKNVSGIGDNKYEKLKDLICVK